MAACEHLNFKANVRVGRLTKEEGGPVSGYSADVTVQCSDCGLPFRFIGLAAGNHFAEPRVSVDGTELRAPIEPATHEKFTPRASYAFPSKIAGGTDVKLSELIAAYGDDKVEFQNLDQCADSLNMNGGVTRITFGTPQRIHLDGTEKLGLVVWMDRERVAEIIAASKGEQT